MRKIFIGCVLSFLGSDVFADVQIDELVTLYRDNKYYNQVCWLTSHNSFAYKDARFSDMFIYPNQEKSIYQQLSYGIRSFMVDLHYKDDNSDNAIILAHENSLTGGKNYVQRFSFPFLSTIKEWLVDPSHQNDIITIHLESYVENYDKIRVTINEAGLGDYLFDLCKYNGGEAKKGQSQCVWPDDSHKSINQLKWPTLGEMRKQGKRLVIFSDKVEDAGYGIIPVSGTMETKYDLDEFSNCEKRDEGRSQNALVFIVNHFYAWQAVPGLGGYYREYKNKPALEFEEIAKRIGICTLQERQWPTFFAVDYVGDGDEKDIVININKMNDKSEYSEVGAISSVFRWIKGWWYDQDEL